MYAFDRHIVQLKRAGKLRHLAGLIVGHMVDMKESDPPFGQRVHEIIRSHTSSYTYPIAFELPIGHQPPNKAFLHGGMGTLHVTEKGTTLTF